MTARPYSRLDLTDRSIIVTGAASGIGAATARLLAQRGAKVVVADLNEVGAQDVAASIRDAGGIAVHCQVDVGDEESVKAMVVGAVAELGGLDGAVNNAGISIAVNRLTADVELTEWQRMVDINLTSVFVCLKHELSHMLDNGGGAIVNMSSVAGLVAIPNAAQYVSSKHGVIGLTKSASLDHAAAGVRVNAVLPAVIDTPMTDHARSDPALAKMMETGHPIGHTGKAEDVAEMVAFLLSDAAAFITGAAIPVDGGFTSV